MPDINAVIQAEELSDIIAGTEITKRNIAAQTMHNLLQEGGRKKRRRSRKTRKSRKSKKSRRRTYKRRR